MKYFLDQTSCASTERVPNPSYNEENLWEDVEEERRKSIKFEQEEVRDSILPKFKKLAQRRLDDLLNNRGTGSKEVLLWQKIHELTQQLPFCMGRKGVEANTQLQKDLDDIIHQHFNYDLSIELLRRGSELVRAKHKHGKLPVNLEKELVRITTEVTTVILPKLYIEMRRLGYTDKDLHT